VLDQELAFPRGDRIEHEDRRLVALADRLRRLAEDAQRLLAPRPPPAGRVILRRPARAKGAATARAELLQLAADLERAIEEAGDGVELSGEIVVLSNPKDRT
jgi:hypothetical protein